MDVLIGGKTALYFGCWNEAGHNLYDVHGYCVHSPKNRPDDLPWGDSMMDSHLLINGKVSDVPDGRVFWTTGGRPFWYAFYWWDRSVDERGRCNSGFYVRGFGWPQMQEALDYACSQFPHVVNRQRFPLVLQKD